MRNSQRPSGGSLEPFQDPHWDAPLDAEREIEAIPAHAMIRGMFMLPAVNEAKRLPPGRVKVRERYVPFQFYPVREHARLLVDLARALFPDVSLRVGLRRLGRGAPDAFVSSTLGRVVLQSVQGVQEVVGALAKGYELSMQPGRASMETRGARRLVVRLDDVYYFVDCHHVGAFEGALKYAGERGRIRVHKHGSASASLLIEW